MGRFPVICCHNMNKSPWSYHISQDCLCYCYSSFFIGAFLNLGLATPALSSNTTAQNCTGSQVEQYIAVSRDPYQGSLVEPIVKICGPTAIPVLINTLQNDMDAGVRIIAATSLGFIGGDACINPLMDTLKNDPDSTVRSTAADALGTIRASSAVPLLIAKLEQSDENIHVRQSAAKSLGDIRDKESIGPLMNLLGNTHQSLELRRLSASSLAQIGDSATDALAAALQESDLRTRYWTVMALSEINSPRALNILTTNQSTVSQILDNADQANIIESYRVPAKTATYSTGKQITQKSIICQIPWIAQYWGRCQ
jgi:HEAT repeats